MGATYQDTIRTQTQDALDTANALKTNGSTTNPRELSIVITKLEEALLWLTKVN